ncbi:hypothetical protein NF681_11275 [Comamonadaceae bacterium OTU4NAUVB1]|nr:hypothetical protein NF681_11275 [Comamonadaceae bacterium OTU4NAUVB1]
MITAKHTPFPVLTKALAALRMVKDLEPSQSLTSAQWLRVVHAHNELEGHIDGFQLDAKADAAITRGPQIAQAMGVQLPARSM